MLCLDPKVFAVCSLMSGWDAAVPALCDAGTYKWIVINLPALGHDGRVKSRQGVAFGALGNSGVSLERCGHVVSIFACGDGSLHANSPVFLRPFYTLV